MGEGAWFAAGQPVSDEELLQLERELRGEAVETGHTPADEDELAALEAELNGLDAEAQTPPRGGTPADGPSPAASPPALEQDALALEEELHPLSCFFGDCIEEELDVVLPRLRDVLQQRASREDVADRLLLLDRKELALRKFQSALLAQAQRGELTPSQYKATAENCLAANKEILRKAVERAAGPEHVGRIRRRVELLREELGTLSTAAMAPRAESPQPDVPAQKEAPRDSQDAKKARSPPRSPANDSETGAAEPIAAQFARKIAYQLSFLDYLRKHFAQSRAADIAARAAIIEQMKEELRALKRGRTAPMAQLLERFPDVDAAAVIGAPRLQRNKEIQDLLMGLKAEIDAVTEKNLRALYTAHYVKLFRQLKEVMESECGVVPKVVRKSVVFPYNDCNQDLSAGELAVRPLRVSPVKPGTQLFLRFELEYDDGAWSFESDYCAENGEFRSSKVLSLGPRLSKRICRKAFKVTLLRRKYLFSSEEIASAPMPLSKLETLCSFREKVAFRSQKGAVIQAEIAVASRKSIGQSHKEVELLCVAETYPIFSLRQTNSALQSAISKSQESSAPSKTAKNEKEAKDVKELTQRLITPPKKDATSGLDESKSKLKYPLLPTTLKLKLRALIAKNNLPETYCDFEDQLLCVSFLEDFSNELEAQIPELRSGGDLEGSRSAQTLFMSVQKKLNSMCKSIEEGKMTPEQYRRYLEDSLPNEQKIHDFYCKTKIENAIIFMRNRLEALRAEIAKLREM